MNNVTLHLKELDKGENADYSQQKKGNNKNFTAELNKVESKNRIKHQCNKELVLCKD